MINDILTPLAIWKGFDSSLILKSSTVSELTIDGINYEEVYFSGRQTTIDRVRIYGCYAKAKENTNSTILIVPDYSSTVSDKLVLYFAKRGYNVLMIDLRGKFGDSKDYTVYPKDIIYANYEFSRDYLYAVHDDAYHTAWYEWSACVKYAISFILDRNKNAKIGLLGLKNGANVCWQVAATEDRVKAVSFIFGAGNLAYKGIYKNVDQEPQMTDERFKFLAGVDMQSYAQFVKIPTLFLTSVNNFEFEFERAVETVARIPNQNDVRNYYTVDFEDILAKSSLNDLNLFFAKHIKRESVKLYKTPLVTYDYTSGKINCDIKLDTPEDVIEIEIFYSFNNLPPFKRSWSRLYYKSDSISFSDKFSASIVALPSANSVLTFVNVFYSSGFAISSKVFNIKLNSIGESGVNKVIFGNSYKVYYLLDCDKRNLLGELFLEDEHLVSFEEGPFGIIGITSKYKLKTNVLDLFRGKINEDTLLKFDVYAHKSASVKITLKTINDKEFFFEQKLLSGEFWQNLSFTFNSFKDKSGREIEDYTSLMTLILEFNGKVLMNNLLVL